MDAQDLLKLDNITIKRGSRVLATDISFTLTRSQGLRLTGPNGSGKSTFLKTLAGIHYDWHGTICWRGHRISALPSHMATHLVSHQNALKPTWTAIQNLRQWTGQSEEDNLLNALATMNVAHLAHVPCRYLSAGQARRVCLSRLFVTQAEIWLLDEPGVSLDTAGRDLLARQIQTFLDHGGMAIIVTHGDVFLPSTLELRFQAEAVLQ